MREVIRADGEIAPGAPRTACSLPSMPYGALSALNIAAGAAALDRPLRGMGEHPYKKTPTLRALRSWADEQPNTASEHADA